MSKTTNKFSPEVRERAVRLVLDNQGQHGSRWQAVLSISAKIGCAPQTLNDWVNKAEVDSGKRAGVSSEMAEKMKALERENRELRQANEILRKASAYFTLPLTDWSATVTRPMPGTAISPLELTMKTPDKSRRSNRSAPLAAFSNTRNPI